LRLAVISPFLDRRHGTERCIVEQLERFAARPGVEIHVYSQRVEDLAGVVRYGSSSPGRIVWHKISAIHGPHLLNYIWWFFANHIRRLLDSQIRGLKFDLVYTPGINALDADAISVHIVFHEFYAQVLPQLRFRDSPVASWPRLLHRRLYYRLIMTLEWIVYRGKETSLTSISELVSIQLAKHFQRTDSVTIRYGVDTARFSPSRRIAQRASIREQLGIVPEQLALLLIGNDWKKKGLTTLLNALAACSELPLIVMVVGSDDRRAYDALIRRLGISGQVRFLEPSSEVFQFYAAADAYVGPSLEDAYGLPILEAMACGLPVIASSRAGASEIIRDGQDGFVLHDPEDSSELAALLRKIYSDASLRKKIGEEAARAAGEHTWEDNATATWEFLNVALEKKAGSSPLPSKTHS
jgi:UDP-glucose:(heptosyl)LPS alpha-1,3-glucosyltransferase